MPERKEAGGRPRSWGFPFRPGLRLKLTAALASVVVLTILSSGYFTIRHSYDGLKHLDQARRIREGARSLPER